MNYKHPAAFLDQYVYIGIGVAKSCTGWGAYALENFYQLSPHMNGLTRLGRSHIRRLVDVARDH